MNMNIGVIRGDGIGPEIAARAQKVPEMDCKSCRSVFLYLVQ